MIHFRTKSFVPRLSVLRDGTPRMLSIHFSQHNIYAAEDHDHVGYAFAQTHIFKHGQIDQAWRANAITIRIRRAVADQVKTEFALRRFNAPIGFARLGTETANL